jgi:hypothetical protein
MALTIICEELVRSDEPSVDTLSLESSSEEEAVDDDFAEEMTSIWDKSCRPFLTMWKKTLIDFNSFSDGCQNNLL